MLYPFGYGLSYTEFVYSDLAVTLQDGNDWADHQSLYEYGFAAYPARWAAQLGHELAQAAVKGGIRTQVPLIAADSFAWPLAQGEALKTDIRLDRELAAPLRAGTSVGEAVFTLNGKEVGRIGLLCGETVLPGAESAMAALRNYR